MLIKPFFEKLKVIIPHTCRVCGRVLKNPKSIAIGIGPVCLTKTKKKGQSKVLSSEIIPRLFDLEEEDANKGKNKELPKS